MYLFPSVGVGKDSDLVPSTDIIVASRVTFGAMYTSTNLEGSFPQDIVFHSFHHQAKKQISDRVLLAGFSCFGSSDTWCNTLHLEQSRSDLIYIYTHTRTRIYIHTHTHTHTHIYTHIICIYLHIYISSTNYTALDRPHKSIRLRFQHSKACWDHH